jgi:multicomponent Na+:H+ antiporter subunit B
MTIEIFIDILLLFMLLLTALFIQRMKNLFSAVILTGIFSLLSASLFLTMDAVDVSFTEASVGAGIATLLFLGTLAQTSSTESRPQRLPVMALVVVSLTGLMLIYGISDIPSFGDPGNPVQTYLSPRFIEVSPREIGIPNMVTSVLASYRGYDTLGEVTVIFTACVGVLLMLGRGRKRS